MSIGQLLAIPRSSKVPVPDMTLHKVTIDNTKQGFT